MNEGRFGRMFRNLPGAEQNEQSLAALGAALIQQAENGAFDKPLGEADDDENTSQLDGRLRLPAGYTYFGQFVDHDITFDPVSSLTRQNDPDGLTDFRTPRFDLDSLYGRGPSDQPYLYADGIHLALGDPRSEEPRFAGPDLPRASGNARALIGDPRNDENLIVSQLQVALIRFHNAMVDRIGAENPDRPRGEVFRAAQRMVRWHYQWVVIHDFLPRLVGASVLVDLLGTSRYGASEDANGEPLSGDVVTPRLHFYGFHKQPYMPVEFSVAAYRFGHSMIRPSYRINEVAAADPAVPGFSRIPLFVQSGSERQSLNGFRPLPTEWGVEWRFFLDGINDGRDPDPQLPQPSYKIDAELSNPLGALPNSTAEPETLVPGLDATIAQDLAVRNLIRGRRLDLPSGQDVARAMGIEPIGDDQLYAEIELDATVRADLDGRAPLWFYVLKEAEVKAGSAHLGPVGGRIVAEVLVGLLAADPSSFLRVEPKWTPTLPAATQGTFTLADLINIAIPAPDAPAPPPAYTG